jgi:TonB family protein
MTQAKIGKYLVQGEIGRGAMGVVYKAVDPVIGRTVAIKTIRFDVLTNTAQREEAQKRFLREAQSAGGLTHPNIVTIYDVGEAEGLTYIAMEYVEGRSLESLLASGPRWESASAAVFVVQVAEALETAHRKGIIHRDVKPGNILVDAEGRPHLVDFGIARITSSAMTQTSMVMGTPYYMAPEQIAGRKIDHRADIFALGAVLYEMLTLEKPFAGDTVTTIIYKIMHETPAPVRSIRGELPARIEAVIEKALAKDLDFRYSNCGEFVRDLRLFLDTAKVGAPLPTIVVSGTGKESGEAAGRTSKSSTAIGLAAAKNRNPLLVVVGLIIVGGVLLFGPGDSGDRTSSSGGAGSFEAALAKGKLETPSAKPGLAPGGGPGESRASISSKGQSPTSGRTEVPPKKNETISTLVETNSAPSRALVVLPPTGEIQNREMTLPGKEAEPKPAALAPGRVLAVPPPTGEVQNREATPPGKEAEPKPAAGRKGETRLPRLLRRADPIYPDSAIRARVEGDVILEITVGLRGRVERANIIKSIPLLDQAALDAVKNWEFEPGLMEGSPIPATLEFTIHFSLPAQIPPPVSPPSGRAMEEVGKKIPERPKPVETAKSVGPAAELAKANDAMNRRAYREALGIAKALLAAAPGLAEAKSISQNAIVQLAPGEIKTLLDQYVLAYKIGQPSEFYTANAPGFYDRIQGDVEMMMNTYRDIQISVSSLTLDFKESRFPSFRIRAVFSQMMTGVSRVKGVRDELFKGRYVWTLERAANDWRIVNIAVE